MSRLDELIKELCPDGVKYKPLKEATEMKRGTSATKAQMKDGEYPVISGGKEPAFFCDTYNREGETITIAGSGAGAGFVQYWNEPIYVNDAFSVVGTEELDTKFVYYHLSNIQEAIYATKKGSGVPHVHIKDIENFTIPVPPLEVQREIVRILDRYSETVNDIKEELDKELTARRKQYEYYLNKLLYKNCESIELKQCCSSISDGDHQAPPKTNEGIPFITISNFNNNKIDFTDTKFVPEEYYNSIKDIRKAQEGDILYSVVGSFGIPVLVDSDKPFVFQRHIAILKPDKEMLFPKYLYYCMKSKRFYDQADAVATGAAQRTVGLGSLGNLKIPYCSLEEQSQVIQILDKFETVCNDITAGLPAEIEARQKQYEYYRDKLLTFKEKEA